MPAVLALISAALFGAADFTGGFATRRLPVLTVTLVTNVVGAGLAVVLVITLGGEPSSAAFGWGAAGGAFGLVGLVCLYRGLAIGPASLVSPLSGVLAAVIPVVFGIATGDRPGLLAAIGLVLTPPAIWLVAGGDRAHGAVDRRALGLGVGAGLGFGGFFVLLAQTPDDAGAWPLVAARAASVSLLVVALVAVRGATPKVPPSALGLPAVAGVLDMGANGCYLWSTRGGELAVVSALTNLYPVTTIVLSIVILHERLTRSQAVGLALAVSAAALLSL